MKKFQTMDELIAYMVGTNAPNELKNVAIESMQPVEEINKNGATEFLIIAETQAEANQVETEYALSNCVPELDELFTCHNGMKWRQRVFVFSDDGGGIMYLERVPLLP